MRVSTKNVFGRGNFFTLFLKIISNILLYNFSDVLFSHYLSFKIYSFEYFIIDAEMTYL